jgi:hypothetical protein
MGGRRFDRHHATHAVAHDNRAVEFELATHPSEIVGEVGHFVGGGGITRTVAAQIGSYDPMRLREVRDLWRERPVIAAPTVHQHHRGSGAGGEKS